MLMTRGQAPFRTVLRPGNGVLNRFSKWLKAEGDGIWNFRLSRIRDITRAGFGIENDASGRPTFKILEYVIRREEDRCIYGERVRQTVHDWIRGRKWIEMRLEKEAGLGQVKVCQPRYVFDASSKYRVPWTMEKNNHPFARVTSSPLT